MVILVYDYDFFHYPSVIPNLECAKYSAWRKKHKDIVVFHDEFQPSMYTKTFFRKEYDDGIYDTDILNPSIEYGGRAFSSIYRPFDLEMESILPDFEMYKKYSNYYGKSKHRQEDIRTILYSTHVRLSLDGKTLQPFPYDRLSPRHPNIILHDYDPGNIPNVLELLKDVSGRRPSGLPYRIGNKYPINVYTYDELKQWLDLPPASFAFYLQFNGVLEDEQLIELCEKPILGLRQMFYNFTYGCSDENDCLERVLPKIYKQMLFLRSQNQKILLDTDTDFFKTSELKNFIKLIYCFYGKTEHLQFIRPHKQTLYEYCAWKKRRLIEMHPWKTYTIYQQDMRDIFQYIRTRNYELFDMFYSTPNVIAKGGKLVNEWERNS